MTPPLRLVLSNPRKVWGGSATNTVNLAIGLRDRGHDVMTFLHPEAAWRSALEGRVRVEPVLGGVEFSPRVILRCQRLMREQRTQLLLSNTNKDLRLAAPAARLMGVPVAMVWHSAWDVTDRIQYRFFYGTIPDHYIAVSEVARRKALNSAPWIRRERMQCIPNGVDIDRIRNDPPSDLGMPEGTLAIGHVSRISKKKGLLELAQAWKHVSEEVPNASLFMVGEPEGEARPQQYFEDSPRVHWLGFRDDIPSIMKALDIFVLPSHMEGLPNVVLEAMAASVPVVATPVGGIPDLIEDGKSGLLVPVGDGEELGRTLTELAGDPDKRRSIGEAGYDRVAERYSLKRMIDSYERLLRRLTSEAV